jgi:hypothetical protein
MVKYKYITSTSSCVLLLAAVCLAAQEQRQYNGKYFSLQYPQSWTLQETSEASIVMVNNDSASPALRVEIGTGQNAPSDRAQLAAVIRDGMSATAAAQNMRITFEDPISTDGNGITLIAHLFSATKTVDIEMIAGQPSGFLMLLQIVYKPGALAQANALVNPIVQSLQWKILPTAVGGGARDDGKHTIARIFHCSTRQDGKYRQQVTHSLPLIPPILPDTCGCSFNPGSRITPRF